jgi:hypothetical protein
MANAKWHLLTGWGLALTAIVFATACTSTAPSTLSSAQRTLIEGKSVILQPWVTSKFALISLSSTIAGGLDPYTAGANAVKASKAGSMIIEQDHLTDPATVIGPALLADLASKYGMKSIQVDAPSADAAATPPLTPSANFTLSIEVPVWETMYLPTHFGHYGVMLVVNARIMDGTSAKIVREARCLIRPRNALDAPTFTELMENDGSRLRVEVDYANQACVESLKHSLLGE